MRSRCFGALMLFPPVVTVSHPFLTHYFLSFAGSVDLLLHLLSSITDLPVTKSMVVSSGMGKDIRDIEKHKICAGTANETAIKTRVKAVKDSWNASVKVNKVCYALGRIVSSTQRVLFSHFSSTPLYVFATGPRPKEEESVTDVSGTFAGKEEES